MAEYSKEFIELKEWNIIPDFSILQEFQKLKEGKSINLICEGFGFTSIIKEDGRCYLFYHSLNKKLPFEELIT